MSTDIKQMSAAQLKVALKKKQAEERKEAERLRREYERDRNALVTGMVQRIQEAGEGLRAIKAESISQLMELQQRSYTALGRAPQEELPNSFTVLSEDGSMKLVMERKYKGILDETALVAIDMIKSVLKDKFEARNKSAYKIIDTLLKKNKQGDYDETALARLRKLEEEVANPRFSEAMVILARSYRPTTSQLYVRAYQLDKTGRWDQVDIQFSKM